MNHEQVWGTLEFYEKELAAKQFPIKEMTPAQYDEKYPGVYVILSHCRWMAYHCLTVFKPEYEAKSARDVTGWAANRVVEYMVEAMQPILKAMRWMCYIQGVCNANGIYSCNELRDHSRSGGGKVPVAEFERAFEEPGRVSSADPTLNNLSKQAVPQTPAIPATPPKPPGGYGASSDADWDAE